MNDNLNYDEMKNMINRNNNIDYEETKQVFDNKEQNYRLINSEKKFEVKTKEVPKEKKSRAGAKFLAAAAITLGLAGGSITMVDLAQHPEDYLTTHPEFEGTPTISEILDRTPDNFGIGGR